MTSRHEVIDSRRFEKRDPFIVHALEVSRGFEGTMFLRNLARSTITQKNRILIAQVHSVQQKSSGLKFRNPAPEVT
jgi:hypothetical protein